VGSKSDPRWNNKGRCIGDISSVPDMERWIKECRAKFGRPPADMIKSFCKD
jgi:hypothetical protein